MTQDISSGIGEPVVHCPEVENDYVVRSGQIIVAVWHSGEVFAELY